MYPTPLLNVIDRDITYHTPWATMLSVFVDLAQTERNAGSTFNLLSGVTATVHENGKRTTLAIPNSKKDQVRRYLNCFLNCKEIFQLCRKVLDQSANGLIAFGVSWNVPPTLNADAETTEAGLPPRADSHLVYVVNEQDEVRRNVRDEEFQRVFTANFTCTPSRCAH